MIRIVVDCKTGKSTEIKLTAKEEADILAQQKASENVSAFPESAVEKKIKDLEARLAALEGKKP